MITALIVNPTKTDDTEALHRTVAARCAALGLAAPVLLETTEDDAGEGLARQALKDGATLVLAAGGDGTVRSVCCAMRDSDVPLGVLPLGTGNLLARNLHLPLDLKGALEVALSDNERLLDLGQVAIDEGTPDLFVVMAGVGFDAQMMADAPERVKAAVGWPAYVLSGLKHLFDPPVRLDVCLDGGESTSLRARGIVVGNVGSLQAGVALLPDAAPDDGVLDVVVLAPRGALGWGRVLVRLVTRSGREDAQLHRATAREVRITTARPLEAQLDGESLGKLTSLSIQAIPGCLRVRVPATDA